MVPKQNRRLAIISFSFFPNMAFDTLYRFLRLIRSNRSLYKSCPKHTKLLVAKAIVQAIKQQDPPGDFIKLCDAGDNLWTPITYSQAVNKTSQALREKGPNSSTADSKNTNNKNTNNNKKKNTNQKKILEIAKEATQRTEVEGAQISESILNLTNATIQSARPSKNKGKRQQSLPTQNRKMGNSRDQVLQQQTVATSMTSGRDQQQQEQQQQYSTATATNPRHVGQKRKMMDFVKPSWWGMEFTTNGMNTISNSTSNVSNGLTSTAVASGTVVTPGMDTNFNNEDDNNKRLKVRNGVAGNTDTKRRGGGHEIKKNMRKGAVNRVNQPASSTMQATIDETPFPMETTLGARQSTLFRFLDNTTLFGRGASVAPAPAIGISNPSSATAAGSFDGVGVKAHPAQLQNDNATQNPASWPQQTASDRINSSLQYQQQEQRTSMTSFSSDIQMGRTSVQKLQSQQLQEQESLLASGFDNENNKVTTDMIGFEEKLEEISTSELRNGQHSSDGGEDGVLSPPKASKTQISDWLNSVFPSPIKRGGSSHTYNHTTKDGFDSSSNNNDTVDNWRATIPPPPGGGSGLGRSASSAIFGLVESPSLLLTSLKSGVSSLFGDSIFPQSPVDAMLTPIRRFPSTFQQQQQQKMRQEQQHMQQQQQMRLQPQQVGGNVAARGAIIGNHQILGEPTKRRSSLLEDFEETPMEMELRNAKPDDHQRGPARYR